ncbi:MAG TPA: sigma-70 family RNA polymerase sigma factor [Acidimicrobiia bacterium]|nr:sigma-70 family RNA polymerase sigma factor [Acidimicrobiia bacterium]
MTRSEVDPDCTQLAGEPEPAESHAAPAPTPMGTLAQLFERHADELVRGLVAAGYTDASDAVQEAFVQAVVHWRRVARYDDPLAWVRRVAINKARNRSRGRRRQAALTDRLSRAPVGFRAGETPDDDVVDAVARLTAQQRLVVSLFYYGDLPVVEVAAAMGISEGTVKSHLHAARAAVAQTLGGTP